METHRRSLTLFASIFLLLPGTAFADTPTTDDPEKLFGALWGAITSHRWGLAAVLTTMLLVAFIRFVAPKISERLGQWVKTTRVSAVLALLSGGLAAMSTQLMQGGKLSMNLLVYGFGIGVGAIGGYNAFWDLIFPADKKKVISLEGAEVLAQEDAKKSPPPPEAGRAELSVVMAIAGIGLALAIVMAGCASGTDGLRQACTNASDVLAGGYQTAASLYKVKQERLRATLTKDSVESAKATLAEDVALVNRVIAALDAASKSAKAICNSADTIDAGQKKDVQQLIVQLIQITADIRIAVADLQKLLSSFQGVTKLLATFWIGRAF